MCLLATKISSREEKRPNKIMPDNRFEPTTLRVQIRLSSHWAVTTPLFIYLFFIEKISKTKLIKLNAFATFWIKQLKSLKSSG